MRNIFQKVRKVPKPLKLKLQPKKPNPQMLRELMGSPLEVGEGEKVEEVVVGSEEAVEMTLTGTVVYRRATFPGTTKSFGCIS